jgi:hypothetical protein
MCSSSFPLGEPKAGNQDLDQRSMGNLRIDSSKTDLLCLAFRRTFPNTKLYCGQIPLTIPIAQKSLSVPICVFSTESHSAEMITKSSVCLVRKLSPLFVDRTTHDMHQPRLKKLGRRPMKRIAAISRNFARSALKLRFISVSECPWLPFPEMRGISFQTWLSVHRTW